MTTLTSWPPWLPLRFFWGPFGRRPLGLHDPLQFAPDLVRGLCTSSAQRRMSAAWGLYDRIASS